MSYMRSPQHRQEQAERTRRAWAEKRRAAPDCPAGCTCGKHSPPLCPIGCTCDRHAPRTLSEEHKRKIAEGLKAHHRRNPGIGGFNWSGGHDAAEVAKLLCPLGYEREQTIRGTGWRYKLDFVLRAEKINIELDGRWHMSTPEEDALRDSRLRALGWKVIRVKGE